MTSLSEVLRDKVNEERLANVSSENALRECARVSRMISKRWTELSLEEMVLGLDTAILSLSINARRAIDLADKGRPSIRITSKDKSSPCIPDLNSDAGLRTVLNKIIHHEWLHPLHLDGAVKIEGYKVECDNGYFTQFDIKSLCSAIKRKLKTLYPNLPDAAVGDQQAALGSPIHSNAKAKVR